MQSSYLIVPDFFERAHELRACFDRHFADPAHSGGPSHQIWDYWHVPTMYTYLRTQPGRVIRPELMERLVAQLKAWAMETLGLSEITPPYLSLYVNGCGQGLHNDSGNGRWGFVYSLTNWDQRRFSGGETLVFHESSYWETEAVRRPGAGSNFYDLVPARFNQLLVFDDRVIHGVPAIQGDMAPQDGRVVIHGHIREGGIVIDGPLADAGMPTLAQALGRIRSGLERAGQGHHGCVCVRLEIDRDGRVTRAARLSDRVYRTSPHAADPERLVCELTDVLATLRFPAASGRSVATVPVAIG